MNNKNYYEILGIDSSATTDEIKIAYRKLALQYHPDRNPQNITAEEKFKKINEAYTVISSPEKRFLYDSSFKNSIDDEQNYTGNYYTKHPRSFKERLKGRLLVSMIFSIPFLMHLALTFSQENNLSLILTYSVLLFSGTAFLFFLLYIAAEYRLKSKPFRIVTLALTIIIIFCILLYPSHH